MQTVSDMSPEYRDWPQFLRVLKDGAVCLLPSLLIC